MNRKQVIDALAEGDDSHHVTHPTIFKGFMQTMYSRGSRDYSDREIQTAWHYYFCGWLDSELRVMQKGEVT